jgi:hypothetical protein
MCQVEIDNSEGGLVLLRGACGVKTGSPGWTRTNNMAVNSRPLYH